MRRKRWTSNIPFEPFEHLETPSKTWIWVCYSWIRWILDDKELLVEHPKCLWSAPRNLYYPDIFSKNPQTRSSWIAQGKDKVGRDPRLCGLLNNEDIGILLWFDKTFCVFCVSLSLSPLIFGELPYLLVQSYLSAVILGFTSTSPRYFDNKWFKLIQSNPYNFIGTFLPDRTSSFQY